MKKIFAMIVCIAVMLTLCPASLAETDRSWWNPFGCDFSEPAAEEPATEFEAVALEFMDYYNLYYTLVDETPMLTVRDTYSEEMYSVNGPAVFFETPDGAVSCSFYPDENCAEVSRIEIFSSSSDINDLVEVICAGYVMAGGVTDSADDEFFTWCIDSLSELMAGDEYETFVYTDLDMINVELRKERLATEISYVDGYRMVIYD